jgi:hypothetical protein
MAKNPLWGLFKRYFDNHELMNKLQMNPKNRGFWTFRYLSVNNKKETHGGSG